MENTKMPDPDSCLKCSFSEKCSGRGTPCTLALATIESRLAVQSADTRGQGAFGHIPDHGTFPHPAVIRAMKGTPARGNPGWYITDRP